MSAFASKRGSAGQRIVQMTFAAYCPTLPGYSRVILDLGHCVAARQANSVRDCRWQAARNCLYLEQTSRSRALVKGRYPVQPSVGRMCQTGAYAALQLEHRRSRCTILPVASSFQSGVVFENIPIRRATTWQKPPAGKPDRGPLFILSSRARLIIHKFYCSGF